MSLDLNTPSVEKALKLIDENRQVFIDNGKKFWSMPELSYEEYETSQYAIEQLEKLGYQVTKGLSVTGFRTDLDTGRPGPTVALMGEMDALHIPDHFEAKNGNAHGCGHHTHINSLVGAAWVLKHCPELLSEMSGKIAFIGTPAEEGSNVELCKKYIAEGRVQDYSGKISMYRQGVFDDVDVAFMNHCSGKSEINCRLNSGAVKKKVEFHGVACHGAWPEDGISAMSQMTLAQCAIGLLRERMTSGMRIHGIITDGGIAANIIPAHAEMSYYVRGTTIDELTKVSQMFDEAVIHCAQALGGSATITNFGGTLPVKPEPVLGKVFQTVCAKVIPWCKTAGDFVKRPGVTDIGDISTIMPALHGGAPGFEGIGHGATACTPDEELAYVAAVKESVLMLYLLLKNNAEEAKNAMAEFGPKLTHEEYEAIRQKICK